MESLLIVVVGAVAGFVVARLLRRPATRAEGLALGRAAAGAVGARRHLDLPQLQRAAFSEMVRHVLVRRGVVHVPDRYVVRLSSSDHDTVAQAPGFFRSGLVDALRNLGRREGWDVPGTVSVDLQADRAVRDGQPAVDVPGVPAPVPRPARDQAPAPVRSVAAGAAWLTAEDGGRWELPGRKATVGRGSDQDVRLEDERASRRHATLRRTADGTWSITDEGSSNGTRVNGDRLAARDPRPLADGDEVRIGPVRLTFGQAAAEPTEAPAASPAAGAEGADGTVALDGAELEAVSRELFPSEQAAR